MNIKKIGITVIMVIMLMLGYFMLSDRELYYDGCGTGEGEIHLDASVSIAQKIVGNEKDLQKIVFYIANGDALDESTTLTAYLTEGSPSPDEDNVIDRIQLTEQDINGEELEINFSDVLLSYDRDYYVGLEYDGLGSIELRMGDDPNSNAAYRNGINCGIPLAYRVETEGYVYRDAFYAWALIMLLSCVMLPFAFVQNSIDRNRKWWLEYVVFAGLAFFLIMGLAIYSGIIDSGYHYIDDHEIVTIGQDIQENGFFSAMCARIKSDLQIRYRITYWLFRIIKIALFGDNFMLWHIEKTLEAFIAIFMFYCLARKIGCNSVISSLLAGTLLIGPHDAIIWRLGPQELQGIILFMGTLFAVWYYQKHKTKKSLCLLIVMTFLSSAIKESFLLITPIFILFLVYLELSSEKISGKIADIINIVLQNKCYIICNVVSVLFGMIMILFSVSEDFKESYAGVGDVRSISEYKELFHNICVGSFRTYFYAIIITIVVFLLCMCIYLIKNKLEEKQLLKIVFALIILCFGFSMQLVMYSGTVMFERYLMPSVLIVYIFMAMLLSIDMSKCKLTYLFVIVEIMIIFNIANQDIIVGAKIYANDGQETTAIMNYIADTVEEPEDKVFIALSGELGDSAQAYLRIKHDMKYVYKIDSNKKGIIDGYRRGGEESETVLMDDIDMIVMQMNEEADIIEEYGVITGQYIREEKFGYVVYN